MKWIWRCGSWKAAWLAASFGLGACGGPAEVARSPAPTKVAWNSSDTEATSDEAPATAGEAPAEPAAVTEDEAAEAVEAGAIDLDALPAKAEPSAKATPAPEPEPEPEPEPVEEEEEEAVAEAEPAPPPPSAASDPLALELQKRRAQAKARAEAKKEKPKKEKARAKKKEAAAEAAPAVTYKGSDPCRAASFSVLAVRDACASGGRAAAKRVMKDAIGKATATGQLLKCSSCHSNQRDYALKKDAVADLERWLQTSS